MRSSKWLLFFLCFLSSCLLWAQEGVKGRVINEAHQPVRHATCRLLNANDSLLHYVIAGADGRFSLPWRKEATTIKISAFGYEEQRIGLSIGQKAYEITLLKSAKAFKEVKIKVDPIRRNNDTLYYQVEAFRKKDDQYIEDVLKRLPGIEVDELGKISYGGKAINHVNIEGLNLMGAQYNQATRSMPATAVAQIQVMERNQPIRALEGRESSDRATLNIKLKKGYLLQPFGEGALGLGASPLLWNHHLNALQIARKNQLLLRGEMNNNGERMKVTTQEMKDYDPYTEVAPLPSSFRPTKQEQPPVLQKSVLFNRSYAVGLHYLHAFTPQSTLRTNFLWTHQQEQQDDSTQTTIYGTDTLHIFESSKRWGKTQLIRGKLRYELNHERLFLSNEVKGDWWHTAHLFQSRTNAGQIREWVKETPHHLQNVMTAFVNTPQRLYKISSLVATTKTADELLVHQGNTSYQFQPAQQERFLMRHRVGTSFDLFQHNLSIGYVNEFQKRSIELSTHKEEHNTQFWQHTIETTYDLELGAVSIELNLPIELVTARYSWREKGEQKWFFSPSVDVFGKWGYNLDFTLKARHNAEVDTERLLLPEIMRRNYRTYAQMVDSLSMSRSTMVQGALSYLNTLTLLSWNLFVGWTRTKNDFHTRAIHTPHQSWVFPVWKPHASTHWSASFSLKKLWTKQGVSLSPSASFARNEVWEAYNGREGKVASHVLSLATTAQWDQLSFLHTSLSIGGNVFWKNSDNFSSHSQVLKSAYALFAINAFPHAKLKAYGGITHYILEVAKGVYSHHPMLHTGLRYEVLKSLTLDLSVHNLFNQKHYENAYFQGGIYRYHRLPLRGREALVKVNVKF